MFKVIFFFLSLFGFAYSAPTGFMSSPVQFPQNYTAGVHLDVISCYNSKNNNVFISWNDYSFNGP